MAANQITGSHGCPHHSAVLIGPFFGNGFLISGMSMQFACQCLAIVAVKAFVVAPEVFGDAIRAWLSQKYVPEDRVQYEKLKGNDCNAKHKGLLA
jgi:hypothetical protein